MQAHRESILLFSTNTYLGPNVVKFIYIMKACGNEGVVEIRKEVHAKIIYKSPRE